MKTRLLALVFVTALAISSFAALGVSGASADPGHPVLTVGLNSPKGPHIVNGPSQSTGGAVTAFTAVTSKGPGDIANIDVAFH